MSKITVIEDNKKDGVDALSSVSQISDLSEGLNTDLRGLSSLLLLLMESSELGDSCRDALGFLSSSATTMAENSNKITAISVEYYARNYAHKNRSDEE